MAQNSSGAFKKMSQRALWRGDRGQSQMLESHGLAGMRNNLLRDTPTYKKDAVGLNSGFLKKKKTPTAATNPNNRNVNPNTKINPSINTKRLGSSILDSL